MSRRASGGRASRIALRAQPLKEHEKPVLPGEIGGQYKPLREEDMPSIMETVYKILEEIGFARSTPECTEICTDFGAVMGNDGRLRMPRDVVDKALSMCSRNLTLHAQDPKYDIDLSGQRVHFATAGAAVMTVDPKTETYRDSTAMDLYDMARIADKCEHIHLFQRTCIARDIDDTRQMDINTAYIAAMGTTKHIGSVWAEGSHVKDTLELLHMIAGSEEAWRARPFMSQSNCFVVPPMNFAEDSLDCLKVAVEGGMPVLLLSAAQAGATAPARLAGAVAQAWAECIGGLVFVNAIKPGAPAILGVWPFISDLRTGAMSAGSPEQGVLSAACAQFGNYYDFPTGTTAGMTDSKLPDYQGGAERGYTAAAVALSGANMIYEAAGMYASLLGCSAESLLLDNDVLGACLRMAKGLEVNEETLSYETLKDICLNNRGHYLGSDQTISVMQSDYLYPEYGDRLSPDDWAITGKQSPLSKAIAAKEGILSSYFPSHINDEVDRAIRDKFDIYLTREQMGRN